MHAYKWIKITLYTVYSKKGEEGAGGCSCKYIWSKHLLHNKFSKRIYPGTIHPLLNSTRTESQALNATQGHKRCYQNLATNSVLYKPHRDTSVPINKLSILIPNDGDDPML